MNVLLLVDAMPCVVAIHGNEAVFIQDLPRRLKALKLAELSPGIDTKDFVIKVVMTNLHVCVYVYIRT